jgi:putative spermidine/putrescine transport system permease protein
MITLSDALTRAVGAALALLAAAFLLVPMGVDAILSFDARAFMGPFPPPALSGRWYQALLDNPAYVDGFVNSVRVSVPATLLATVFGTAAAVGLVCSGMRGRAAIETALLSPKFIPTVVVGFGLLSLCARLRIDDGLTRLIAGHLVITLPFVVRAVLASLLGVRPSLLEAAESLGASRLRAVLDILLPAARTGILAGALMAFVLSFDEVAVSLFLSDPFTQTLPLALVAEMQSNLNLSIAAASTVYVAVAAALLLLLDRIVGIDRVVGRGLYR